MSIPVYPSSTVVYTVVLYTVLYIHTAVHLYSTVVYTTVQTSCLYKYTVVGITGSVSSINSERGNSNINNSGNDNTGNNGNDNGNANGSYYALTLRLRGGAGANLSSGVVVGGTPNAII